MLRRQLLLNVLRRHVVGLWWWWWWWFFDPLAVLGVLVVGRHGGYECFARFTCVMKKIVKDFVHVRGSGPDTKSERETLTKRHPSRSLQSKIIKKYSQLSSRLDFFFCGERVWIFFSERRPRDSTIRDRISPVGWMALAPTRRLQRTDDAATKRIGRHFRQWSRCHSMILQYYNDGEYSRRKIDRCK